MAQGKAEKTPEEILKTPISKLDTLTKEQQQIFWAGIGKQLAGSKEIVDALNKYDEMFDSLFNSIKPLSEKTIADWHKLKSEFERLDEQFKTPLEITFGSILAIYTQQDAAALDKWAQTAKIYADIFPYMDKELEENPGIGERPFEELLIAAVRRARADGVEIPLEIKEETRRKRIAQGMETAHRRREKAQDEGSITADTSIVATIAEKGLGYSYFTSVVIKELPEGIEKYIIDPETGKINLYNLQQRGGNLKEVDRLHTAFLMWLLGLAYNNSDIRETNSTNAVIPVYLPAVLKDMGIDPRPKQWNRDTKEVQRQQGEPLAKQRFERFMKFINPLINVAGYFGTDLYQMVGFHSYNEESETVYLSIPYMFRLVEYAKLHSERHKAIQDVFHANIMTENQTAVEIANRIAIGVIMRGVTRTQAETYKSGTRRKPFKKTRTTTDAEGNRTTETEYYSTAEQEPAPVVIAPQPRFIRWEMKFARIIEDCPQLQREIDEIRTSTGELEKAAAKAGKTETEIAAARRQDHKTDPQRVNKKLKDTFDAAIKIIMEKSKMPDYYQDFKITTGKFDRYKAPTNSTLNERLIITHKGKNPDYKD